MQKLASDLSDIIGHVACAPYHTRLFTTNNGGMCCIRSDSQSLPLIILPPRFSQDQDFQGNGAS